METENPRFVKQIFLEKDQPFTIGVLMNYSCEKKGSLTWNRCNQLHEQINMGDSTFRIQKSRYPSDSQEI